MEKVHSIYEQDLKVLKPWVDPLALKKIQGTWYKDERQVVMNSLEHRCTLIQSHHDPPVYHIMTPQYMDILELTEPYTCSRGTTGGLNFRRKPQTISVNVWSVNTTCQHLTHQS